MRSFKPLHSHDLRYGFGLGRPLFFPVNEFRHRSFFLGVSPSGPDLAGPALGRAPEGLAPANFFGAPLPVPGRGRNSRGRSSPPPGRSRNGRSPVGRSPLGRGRNGRSPTGRSLEGPVAWRTIAERPCWPRTLHTGSKRPVTGPSGTYRTSPRRTISGRTERPPSFAFGSPALEPLRRSAFKWLRRESSAFRSLCREAAPA